MTDTEDVIDPTHGKGGDIYAKTLALLRRLLVGNGYKIEDVQLSQIESSELRLSGRLSLDVRVSESVTKIMGLPRGGEEQIFQRREDMAAFISSYKSEINEGGTWIEELRAVLDKTPNQGWGLKKGEWALGKLGKRAALTLPCDFCLGKKEENCQACFGNREMTCTTCQGTAIAPCQLCGGSGNMSGKPCQQCQGRGRIPCLNCQSRGRVPCTFCRATGKIPCRNCQGHGVFTEETTLKVSATGSFVMGSLAAAPSGVMEILDQLGPEGIANGHALITPAPPQGDAALNYTALLPFGHFKMKLRELEQEIKAIGMKPLLIEFPRILDDQMAGIPDKLNAGTLMAIGHKVRLVRELAEALGAGQKPAVFFSQRYPFGLSPAIAFAIAGKMKTVFTQISLQARVIAACLSVAVALGLYYGWLINPHGAKPLFDLAPLALLCGLPWWATSFAGQWSLKQYLPIPVRLGAAGGQVAQIAAAVTALGGLLLLIIPYTRPSWLAGLL